MPAKTRARGLILLVAILCTSCELPSAQDAEIGCAVDAAVSPRCPRPDGGAADAGRADGGMRMDGGIDASVLDASSGSAEAGL